ncbi:DUF4148 domain-containing protein [Trinickia terrae]|uniref:DUF4148 domain-containing protein n=1 Tax=Trinickia terrae TaxID=2571161 RepID=A0A4U1IFA4_9BURK|nr:DUF4148 domain-containing protein [Trinickia terrae]TKC92403.1 DUF4148 domain-containing protein [Trinickia terrae]
MKRQLIAGLALSLLASTSVFAQGNGIGHSGTYNDYSWVGTSTKTRVEVKNEVVEAQRDGSLPSMNKQSYPNLSLQGQTQAERIALQENHDALRLARAGH